MPIAFELSSSAATGNGIVVAPERVGGPATPWAGWVVFAIAAFVGYPTIILAEGAKSLGYLVPRGSQEIASSPWGVQAGDDERPDAFDRAQELGVKWTRLLVAWPVVEKVRGGYDFADMDRAVDSALGRGITPFLCLSNGNALYSDPIPHPNAEWRLIYGIKPAPPTKSPEALKAWMAFTRAVVERYKDRIKHWEIWNEPNHYGYWGAPPDAVEYGKLVHRTAEEICRLQPEAILIAGALAGLDPKFIRDFLAEDIGKRVNIVSFHNYANLPEARIYFADETWNVMRAHNPELQLWQGECGYPSASSTKDFRGTSPWGPVVQAKWLLRQALVDVYFMRATLSNYFKLYDGGDRSKRQARPGLRAVDQLLGFPAEPTGRRVRGVGVNEKCLLSNPGLEPKPGFYAYQNLTSVLDGRYHGFRFIAQPAVKVLDEGQFAGVGENDDAYPSLPLVAAFRSTRGSGLVAYWLPWQPQEFTPKPGRVDLHIPGLTWRDPVLVNLLSGEVVGSIIHEVQPDGTWFRSLPLLDFPVMVVERSEVALRSERNSPMLEQWVSFAITP